MNMQMEGNAADSQVIKMMRRTILSVSRIPVRDRQSDDITVGGRRISGVYCSNQETIHIEVTMMSRA